MKPAAFFVGRCIVGLTMSCAAADCVASRSSMGRAVQLQAGEQSFNCCCQYWSQWPRGADASCSAPCSGAASSAGTRYVPMLLASLARGEMKVALQGHLVGRQVEVLLVLDDFPDLAHAQRQRVPWKLVLTDANETVIACTRTIVLGQADEHWERRACAQGAQGLAQGGE